MKVFELNDIEFWAGEKKEEILKAAMEEYEATEEELTFGDEIKLLSKEEMERFEYYTDPYTKGAPIISFQEQLDNMIKNNEKFPCLFASTEW